MGADKPGAVETTPPVLVEVTYGEWAKVPPSGMTVIPVPQWVKDLMTEHCDGRC